MADGSPVARARRTLVVAATTLALVALACTEPRSDLLPPPSSTSSTESTTTTTSPDYSRVPLERLPGETTTTAFLASGRAAVRGTVLGPDGPVAGAVVRIDRLVGDAVQRREVTSDEGGGFAVEGVPGGRYRVRAFLAPRLTLMEPEVFFLPDGEGRDIELPLGAFEGIQVRASTNPSTPTVGRGVNLAVRVTQQAVDGEGVVRPAPLPGIRVRVRASGWTELGPTTVTTDGAGVAVFEFRCARAGPVRASAVVGETAAGPTAEEGDEGDESGDGEQAPTTTAADPAFEVQTVQLDVPDCSPGPTTTAAAGSDEDGDESTTTTEA
jgi:hypothetical protein